MEVEDGEVDRHGDGRDGQALRPCLGAQAQGGQGSVPQAVAPKVLRHQGKAQVDGVEGGVLDAQGQAHQGGGGAQPEQPLEGEGVSSVAAEAEGGQHA